MVLCLVFMYAYAALGNEEGVCQMTSEGEESCTLHTETQTARHRKLVPATVFLNNGVEMPLMGFGTAGLGDKTRYAVTNALLAGFRHIDSAQAAEWYNEPAVGEVIGNLPGGLSRSQIFMTSKLHPRDFGYDRAYKKFMQSLEDLQTNYVDLFLLHYPACFEHLDCGDGQGGTWQEAWRALERHHEEGRIRSLGVSNFNPEQLEELVNIAQVSPSVVQNYLDPLHQDVNVREKCAQHGIVYTAYSAFGYQHMHRNPSLTASPVLTHPVITSIAQEHEVTAAQVVISWAVQSGVAILPRSSNMEHIRSNAAMLKNGIEVFLSPENMKAIEALDGAID